MMIERRLQAHLRSLLEEYPAVAMLGPRQAGKTTLAHEVAESVDSVYLDHSPKCTLAHIEAHWYRAKLGKSFGRTLKVRVGPIANICAQDPRSYFIF